MADPGHEQPTRRPDASLANRLVWFVALWLAGVLGVGVLAFVIRWALRWA